MLLVQDSYVQDRHKQKFLYVCMQVKQVQVTVAEMPVWREDLAETDSPIHQTVRRQTSGGSTISLAPETADMTPTGESGQVKQSVRSRLINSTRDVLARACVVLFVHLTMACFADSVCTLRGKARRRWIRGRK